MLSYQEYLILPLKDFNPSKPIYFKREFKRDNHLSEMAFYELIKKKKLIVVGHLAFKVNVKIYQKSN